MKKKLLYLLLVAGTVASCKKTEVEQTEKIFDKKSEVPVRLMSAGDGQWDLLGFGYDVTKDFANSNSSTYPIVDVEKLRLENITSVISSGAEASQNDFEVGENVEEFSRKITQKATLTGGAGLLFKGTIDYNFSVENKWSSTYIYGLYNMKVIKRRVYMMHDLDLLKRYLHPKFLSDIDNFSPAELVDLYGTHVLTDIRLGGKLELLYQAETTHSNRTVAAGAGTETSFAKVFGVSVSGTYDQSSVKNNFNQKATARTIGGNSEQTISGITIGSDGRPSATINVSGWASGVTDSNAELVDINRAIPIYDLISNTTKREAVRSYVEQYLLNNQIIIDWKGYDGAFINDNSTGKVYVVMEGKLRHIESNDTFIGLFGYRGDESMLRRVTNLNNLPPVGISLKRDNGLINETSTGKLYLREGNVVRHIATPAVRDKYHFNSSVIVNRSSIRSFVVGPVLY